MATSTERDTVPVELQEKAGGEVVEVTVTGKLDREDYHRFVPELERLIAEHGKIRVLMEVRDFHGWTAGALWEDTKFGFKHFQDIDRLAIVGEKGWEEGMAHFCKPFTTAEVRYFDREDAADAQAWIAGE
jgi:hypothetical protein